MLEKVYVQVTMYLELFSSGHGETCKVLNSAINSVHISQRIMMSRQPPTVPQHILHIIPCTEMVMDKHTIHGMYTLCNLCMHTQNIYTTNVVVHKG